MTNSAPPHTGIIEGFFGRSWRWDQRRQLADFMVREGFDFYLYAPKSDRHLRSRWREHWSNSDWQQLLQLRQHFRDRGVAFGLGLSPLDLCDTTGRADSAALETKIGRLNQLQPDWLGLFFDDMRGDIPHLAQRQAELAHCAATQSSAPHIVLCPTYYSDDPVLDKVFGARPDHYLEDLGRQLDPSIHLFWTGPKVCSDNYPDEHLQQITQKLERRPFIWDNYPVNDGAVKSQHLYLHPPTAERGLRRENIAGIAVNPMNQFSLSLPALSGLHSALKGETEAPLETTLKRLYPAGLAQQLAANADLFAHEGLGQLSEDQRELLLQAYQPFAHHGAGREVIDWLNGEYAFDPACLTE
ncbi:beta-N-acetylglucosaminidase domain-containing protein [Gilvimarinus xylanilyticus]|uniref:Protein O-GlcNAcase n=1 Tax=Gilvimarinus xylanilyticus TaxID=2944139 RepID=A0A9X2KSM8_9GAMM|nr:beta-N-acetylglucosaminidase domain-containing protein [Gilvimarinus xylanilyticus]MCP8898287.1 protein O-GlcNAcase [Gilvimarinus xylanilyticus]